MKPSLEKPMAPPWLKYPQIDKASIGWRMGYGEGYLLDLFYWLEKLSDEERNEYTKMFPAPKLWGGEKYWGKESIDREGLYYANKNLYVNYFEKNGLEKYSVESLIKKHDLKKKLEYIFFFKADSSKEEIGKECLSQWYFSEFKESVQTFYSAEQYMMYKKAELFGDKEISKLIMDNKNPKEIKDLGGKVKNFNDREWNKVKYSIVLNANYRKFMQNKNLKKYLLETKDKILVEASPYDKIWGIGLDENNPKINNPNSWNGINLLGFALTEVRDDIQLISENEDKIFWNQ